MTSKSNSRISLLAKPNWLFVLIPLIIFFSACNNNSNQGPEERVAAGNDTLDWGTWNIAYYPKTSDSLINVSKHEIRVLFFQEVDSFNRRSSFHLDTLLIWNKRDSLSYSLRAMFTIPRPERSRLDSAVETKPPAPRPGPKTIGIANVEASGF